MKAWTIGLALICAVLPFSAVRNHAEVHDDVFLRGPGSLVADARTDMAMLWQADLFAVVGEESGPSGMWRPLVLMSFRAEHYLTNGSAVAFAWLGHVVNILLHAIATLALLFLLVRMGLAEASALLAAGLFGLHPVHAESVAWLSGRSDLGATALIWSGTALLLATSRPTLLRSSVAGAALLAGLLFKETGVLLVCLVPLLGVLAGRSWRAVLPVPALALLGYLVLRAWLFTRSVSPDGYLGPEELGVRWLTWCSILPDVVRLGVWPGPASPLHPVDPAQSMASPGVLSGALILGALLALATWAWRRRMAAPAFALLLLCGTLLLLAPWVRYPTGYREVAAPLYERYVYASACAAPILIAWLLRRWLAVQAAPVVGLLLVALLLIAPVTRARAAVWASDESFARAGLAISPRSADMWNHLGVALLERFRADPDIGSGEEALACFERVLSMHPGHRLASLNQFIALVLLGRELEAMREASLIVQRHGEDPVILDNVAHWHFAEGRWEQAAHLFAREIETGQPLSGAEETLGECLKRLQAKSGAEGGT